MLLIDIRSALPSCAPPRKHNMASQTRNPAVQDRAKRLGGIHSQAAYAHARNGDQTLPRVQQFAAALDIGDAARVRRMLVRRACDKCVRIWPAPAARRAHWHRADAWAGDGGPRGSACA